MAVTLEELQNKTLLLEMNNYNTNKEFMERKRILGTVLMATRAGIALREQSGMIQTLPPAVDDIEKGDPNGYDMDDGTVAYPDYTIAFNVVLE